MLDEGNNVHPIGQDEEALFQPHEEVIDLAGLVAGLLLADSSHGEAMPLAVVHELAVVRFAFFLEGCHWRLLVAEQRQINVSEACAEELQKVGILQNGARSRFRRNSLPCKVPETGIEPALPVMGTGPSTWGFFVPARCIRIEFT